MAAAPPENTSFLHSSRNHAHNETIKTLGRLVRHGYVYEVYIGTNKIIAKYEETKPDIRVWKSMCKGYEIEFEEGTKANNGLGTAKGAEVLKAGSFFFAGDDARNIFCLSAAHGFTGVGQKVIFVAQNGQKFGGTVVHHIDVLDIAVVDTDRTLGKIVYESIMRNSVEKMKMKVWDKSSLDLLETRVRMENGKTFGIVKYIGFRIIDGKLSKENVIAIKSEDEGKIPFAEKGDSGSAVYQYVDSWPQTCNLLGMVRAEWIRKNDCNLVLAIPWGLMKKTLKDLKLPNVTILNPEHIQQDEKAFMKVVIYPAVYQEGSPKAILEMPDVALSKPAQDSYDDIRTTLFFAIDEHGPIAEAREVGIYIINEILQHALKEDVRLFHLKGSTQEPNLRKLKKAIREMEPRGTDTLVQKFLSVLEFVTNTGIRSCTPSRTEANQLNRLIVLSKVPNDDRPMSQMVKGVQDFVEKKVLDKTRIHFLFLGEEPTVYRGAAEHCQEIATLTNGSTFFLRCDEVGSLENKLGRWFRGTWRISSSAAKFHADEREPHLAPLCDGKPTSMDLDGNA